MDYGAPRDDEIPAVGSMLSWAFNVPVTEIDAWIRRAGLDQLRVLRSAERVDACLLMIPMGQFFGGRSVPMTGVAGVATPPETRGGGSAIALMGSMLRELRSRGVPLSTLYPATIGLYRRAGYETAGARFAVKVPLHAITLRDRELPIRPMDEADEAAVEATYRARAVRTNGHLDRGPYVWQRVREPRGESARGFVVGGDRAEGHVILFERKLPAGDYTVHASDLAATTPGAHRRILTFLADHGTLGESVTWFGAPGDPFLHLLPRNGAEVRLELRWMLRVIDVAAALSARGWPAHAAIDLDLDLSDDVLTENSGRWAVRIANGRADVTRGGRGAIRVDVRALAALYTGHADPWSLAASGGLEASDDDLARLAGAFAGPAPWMPDFF